MSGRPRIPAVILAFLFVFGMVVFLPGSGRALVATEFADKVKSPDGYTALRAKAEKNGSIRIIVKVDASFSPRASVADEAASSQRAGIRSSQEQLLAALRSAGRNPLQAYRYKHTPYIAMTVDGPTLDAILQSGSSVTIHEDMPHFPALDRSVPLIGADTLQKAGLTGSGYAVAVLDTGVDKNHPFLKGSVVSEACYSSNNKAYRVTSLCPRKATESTAAGSAMPYAGVCPAGKCAHGTHVAGIVAGRSDISGSPGPGVAPEADIIAIQVFSRVDSVPSCQSGQQSSPCVTSFDSDQKKALERVLELSATMKIAAVNLSLGGNKYTSNCDSGALKADVDNLRAAGIATVAAAGNAGYCGALETPACISSVVSVGATDSDDNVTDFSCSATFMTLFAPGSAINSSIPNRKFKSESGTSMATPHVAGVFALLKQGKPAATVDEIVAALTGTGPGVTDQKCTSVTKRRVNVNEAYKSMSTSKFLNVVKAGAGSGTVTSAPSGINCGASCGGLFADGADVTLTAAASTGQSFTGWSGGDCSGAEECVVTMSDNVTVTATFGSSCTYSVSPDHVTVDSKGKDVTLTVTADDQGTCGAPSLKSDSSWIVASLTSFANNSGKILLKVLANDNPSPRDGKVYIAGKPIPVTQSETTCRPPSLSPSKGVYGAAAGTGGFSVNMSTDCEWIAYVDYYGYNWITITSGTKGSGEGDVSFSITANTTGKKRTGWIRVTRSGASDWKVYTVSQNP